MKMFPLSWPILLWCGRIRRWTTCIDPHGPPESVRVACQSRWRFNLGLFFGHTCCQHANEPVPFSSEEKKNASLGRWLAHGSSDNQVRGHSAEQSPLAAIGWFDFGNFFFEQNVTSDEAVGEWSRCPRKSGCLLSAGARWSIDLWRWPETAISLSAASTWLRRLPTAKEGARIPHGPQISAPHLHFTYQALGTTFSRWFVSRRPRLALIFTAPQRR